MKVNTLEIDKVNDKELRYCINGDSWIGSASVFYAKSVHGSAASIKFINYTSNVSVEVELVNLKVNGVTYTDATEARTAINAFAGSFKKSGGTVNAYTKIEADSKFADKETTELNLSHKADLVNGVVPAIQLPGVVDAIIEVATFSQLPGVGESNKIYITLDDNKQFRWSGTLYAEISASLSIGETESTAHRGDHGKNAYDHSHTTGNPHNTQIGDINGLSDRLTDIEGDVTETKSQSSSAISVSNNAQISANSAISTANSASGLASTAQEAAEAALSAANSALSSSSSALSAANGAAALASTALQPVYSQVVNTTASIGITTTDTAIPGLSITVATAGKYRINVNANLIASELLLNLLGLGSINFSNTQSIASVRLKKGSSILSDSALSTPRSGIRNTFSISYIADLIVGDVISVSVLGVIPAGTLTLVSGAGFSTILSIEKII